LISCLILSTDAQKAKSEHKTPSIDPTSTEDLSSYEIPLLKRKIKQTDLFSHEAMNLARGMNEVGNVTDKSIRPDSKDFDYPTKLVMHPNCERMFESEHEFDERVVEYDKKEFLTKINNFYFENHNTHLANGFSPFCKHLMIPNFTRSKPHCIKLNNSNLKKVKTSYVSRGDDEVPVLTRYIPKDDLIRSRAKFINVVLYTREQIEREAAAKHAEDPNADADYDYTIVSIKPQNEDLPTPLLPITIMRNGLGLEEGGSGTRFNRQKYRDSVKFWKEHVNVL
jgi:hypothetical protein